MAFKKGEEMRAKLIVALVSGLAVSGCGRSDASSAEQNNSSNAAPAPSPNYTEYRKGVYYYASGISEDDQKAGKAAGDVMGFRYEGKNSDGDDVVEALDGQSATCSQPCKVIHLSDGQDIEYNDSSVIGAVFTDVMNGFLKKSKAPA